MNDPKNFASIVQDILENGRTDGSQESLEAEFDFEATEQGWTDEEIATALDSPWFPSESE